MSLQTRLSDLITAIGADQKRYHKVVTTTTSATLTPSGAENQLSVTAQAGALAINNPTPANMVDGQSILFRIKDNGSVRAISWDTYYRAIGVTLPSTTVVSKTLYIGAKWNNGDTKFDVIAVGQEA